MAEKSCKNCVHCNSNPVYAMNNFDVCGNEGSPIRNSSTEWCEDFQPRGDEDNEIL